MCRTVFLLILSLSSFALQAAPKTINHPLTEFTELTLKLVPDLGTRLVFPFVLDNPRYSPPLVRNMTNGSVFDDSFSERQNTIVLSVKTLEGGGKVARYLGNYFVSINGFNIAIQLETTGKTKDHITDVIFDLSSSARTHLIEETVKSRTKELDKAYNLRVASLDKMVEERSLALVGSMARFTPGTYAVKNEETLTSEAGAYLTYYVDRFMIYKNFLVVMMEIENESSLRIAIKSFKLLYRDVTDIEQELAGAFDCVDSLADGEKATCTYTIRSHKIQKNGEYSFVTLTDRGQVTMKW
jgi:hypothetical protein